MGSQDSFEFVMQNPNQKFSSEARAKIRRQAIRAVNAAHGTPGRPPSLGFPSLLTPKGYDIELPLPHMSFSGLELLVSHHGLDPTDLSLLTSIHIGAMSVVGNPRILARRANAGAP